MKEIIINDKNAEKIMAAIDMVQGRATARTIDLYDQLLGIVRDIEARIGKMPKTALEGTTVHYDFRQHFPNAYKYTPSSTHIDLRYHNGSWRLIDIDRWKCPNSKSAYEYELHLSETAKEAILKRYE